MRRLGYALAACLALAGACQADELYADFTILNSASSPSGGQVIFTLNGDGTIAASLVSYGDDIEGFGFNSSASDLPESNFSTAVDNADGWSDDYGFQMSGFACSSCGLTETWTIGNPGDYTSVFQVLDGGASSSYDFFFLGSNDDEWAADAVAAIPEPSSLLLFGAGLLGLAHRMRKKRS